MKLIILYVFLCTKPTKPIIGSQEIEYGNGGLETESSYYDSGDQVAYLCGAHPISRAPQTRSRKRIMANLSSVTLSLKHHSQRIQFMNRSGCLKQKLNAKPY